MIEAHSLSLSYGTLDVLKEISFRVGFGEICSIVGPSGCGKTSLLKIIGGLLSATSGELRNDKRTGPNGWKPFGFVFQNPVLLPWRDVHGNVRLPLEILGERARSKQNPEDLLQEVGLAGFEHAMPNELSGGMQQRTALARALVFEPHVLLMDEPFAAADELLRDRLDFDLVRLSRRRRQTVIFVTHSITEAVTISNRIVVLSHRPATVKAIVKVDLGEDRPKERGSRRHAELVQDIRKLLEQE